MIRGIIHPDSHSKLKESTDSYYSFEDDSKLPVHKGIPVLFGKDSLFNAQDIINAKVTTQDKAYADTKNLKNYVRRKLLPSLAKDFNLVKRYTELADLLPQQSKVLILGTGDKKEFYKDIFAHSQVICSDVHAEFSPDLIFDGHFIPFSENSFDLVLAAQVIEHTINPWQFCNELQRVTKVEGYLQIEAPQTFPYHAQPYDFYRFTYTGMRSLFPKCHVIKESITEGNAAVVAVTLSNYLINLSSVSFIRSAFLFISRLLFGWLKYLDQKNGSLNHRRVSMPKG
ncbi:MAG: methyltransferase domain-containing protein, partial [Winogradskyella sp.]|nr:methyltransferase domain-containing protein [Winogradskyella sp.]